MLQAFESLIIFGCVTHLYACTAAQLCGIQVISEQSVQVCDATEP